MRLFAICRMVGGSPDIDPSATPYHGYVHHASLGNQGAYIFSGTPAQIAALNALPQVVGLMATAKTSNPGNYLERNDPFPAATRTKINNWLTARGITPLIPAGKTCGWVTEQIFRRFHPSFDFGGTSVAEP